MTLQTLVAAVNADPVVLIQKMHTEKDVIVVNQCDHIGEETIPLANGVMQVVSMKERGVGLSRNTAIAHASAEILLFSDQDIVYEKGYSEGIMQAFAQHPEADMILFNVGVAKERETYNNVEWKKVHWYNCGRYGAVSFAIRREALDRSGVQYSLLFGGGAKYSAGEDSLFLKQLMDKGIRVYTSPFFIGREDDSESTWFKGYTEKFFFDRGVLYHFLYGHLATLWGLRFLVVHRKKLCMDIALLRAFGILRKGIKEGKTIH